jgi:hypothetical protein
MVDIIVIVGTVLVVVGLLRYIVVLLNRPEKPIEF